jgi:GT2 family glycosyltransferase
MVVAATQTQRVEKSRESAHELAVVVVNWNTVDLLSRCLRSLCETPGSQPRVVVVDNGSSDGSPEMVEREFPQVDLIRNPDNRGFAAANNPAMRRGAEPSVVRLNSDTEILGDALGASIRYMNDHAEVGVMGCRVLNPDGSLQPTCFSYPSLINVFLMASGLHRLPWPHSLGRGRLDHWARDDERDVEVVTGCFLLARREAVEEVGLLDESFFLFGEETDWCHRFLIRGWSVRFAPVGEIIHVGGGSTSSFDLQRDLLLDQALVRLHRKHSGIASATVAYAMLGFFHASRALFWSALGLSGRWGARERGAHQFAMLKRFREAWV